LPGVTKYAGGGPYDRASDPSVAYDARHHVWLISSLGLTGTGSNSLLAPAVVASRSTDGGIDWQPAVPVSLGTQLDKNWTVCDNTPTSPFYGNCYTEFDDEDNDYALNVATSSDGGLHWSTVTLGTAVIGGQPLVQPDGTIIMPIDNNASRIEQLLAFTSTTGGVSFNPPTVIATVRSHLVAGHLREDSSPSAAIDAAGKVFVVWSDCRFRPGCTEDDLVMSTSTDGTTWTAPARIPIDPKTSQADDFLPGLAVDNTTRGSKAHLALTYYFYPAGNCNASTCHLEVGYTTSADGGTSWTKRVQLAGPMSLSWLANTTQGRMVGDYIATSFVNHVAKSIFAAANAPRNGTFDEAIYTTR